MTDDKAEDLGSVLREVFLRKGKEGASTWLLALGENLDLRFPGITLAPGETPVFGAAPTPPNWVVLTSRRLLWHLDGKLGEMSITDIASVRPPWSSQRLQSTLSAADKGSLDVSSRDGSFVTLQLEAGYPLGGVWSALHFLEVRNRAK